MKSFNVRHIQHHLVAVLADVEASEVIEIRRRGRSVARIVPPSSDSPRADRSHAERRLQAAYPTPSGGDCRSANHRGWSRRTVSLYCDSGVLVKLYVREESSDTAARFLAKRGEAVIVHALYELETRNALRLKRFRREVDDEQPAASMAMLASDFAAGRLVRGGIDWGSVWTEAERLPASVGVGVRTIDLLHVAAALARTASGLVSRDHRQCAAARVSGLEVVALSD